MKLVYIDQNGWEKSVEIGEHNSVVMIGRNPDCQVQTSNGSVSRVHAMVTFQNGKILVQDPPNSRPTNGTMVNGERLMPGEMLELFVGSELLCGNFAIRVESDGNDNVVPRMDNVNPSVQQGLKQNMMQPNPNMYKQGGYNNPMGNYNGQGNVGGYAGDVRPLQPQLIQGPIPVSNQGQYIQNGNMRQNQPMPNPQMVQQNPQMMQQNPQMMQSNPQLYPQDGGSALNAGTSQSNNVVQAQAKRARAPYPSSHQGAAVQAPQNSDEVAKLQEEIAQLHKELEEARGAGRGDGSEVDELKDKLESQDKILSDYERRNEYNETVMTGLKDMIDKLKGQLDYQKEQYQECRRDLVAAQDEAESLKIELSSLKEVLDSKGMATSNAETVAADLKVELSKKNRTISDLQRDLDLAQFSCKEERENVERLKENLATLNDALEESQRRNRDMEKVVEQHEMMFNELKGNLNDRAREIRQLQDSLRAQGGADSAALMQELAQVRDALTRRTAEAELLTKQLKDAETLVNSNAAAAEAEIRSLREQIDGMQENMGANDDELQAKIDELCDELTHVTAQRDALEAAAVGLGSAAPRSDVDVNEVRRLYSEINDYVSQWREDFDTLDANIADLQKVFVAYVNLDTSKLSAEDKTMLDEVLNEYDPKVIYEEIGNCLDSGQDGLAEIKDRLKALRCVLKM